MLYQLPLAPRYSQLTEEQLCAGIREFKRRLGKRLVILGHHYQQDDVIQFADFTGDSLRLSMLAAEQTEAEFIVFCGVHFMAESADILTSDKQTVILPDLSAGCSMADMAHIDQVEEAWPLLEAQAGAPITPITYVNSSAAVKAFVGRHDGACCTSSNAKMVMEWALHGATPESATALEQCPAGNGATEPLLESSGTNVGHKVMFLPDQHLGRNTAYALGWPLESMVVFDPKRPNGGLNPEQMRDAQVFLWKGHCSVHQLFNLKNIAAIRSLPEPYTILVHPECAWEVCQQADLVGSTEYIIRTVRDAAPGTHWAIGTEVHLIHRIAKQNPDKHVRSLAGIQCLCTTMYRIDIKHLYWVLENLVEGRVVNPIAVDAETKHWSRIALDRMLALRPAQPISAK
jgi:quinolinate synthase